ncbi:MAG: hypothetical protein P1U86_11985 [Verrucomicrobiales bacterium]|nr:hypothetical protein [Verrucomicrobiales bacterium]
MSIQTRTIYYATPPDDYFWRWSETYDAAEWRNGKTCTLWAELQPILSYFSENGGIPPLGSIILILAACREDWDDSESELVAWLSNAHGSGGISNTSRSMMRHLSDGLSLVNQLPAELRKYFVAKVALITFIFEESPQRLSPEESEVVLAELTELGPSCLQLAQPDLTGVPRFHRDAKAIKKALEHETVESLESVLRTGIDLSHLEEPDLELEIKEQRQAGTLLEELQRLKGDFAVLSGVAERAIAMIHFPGALQQPDELPIGGVADITNRGSIERLLPAEMAWDDLTLAVRLIHGEALYFRREIPPQESPRKSAVFLDRGLRIWGASRLLTTGIALGITQQARWKTNDLEVYSAAQAGWSELDLSSVDSIRNVLSELVPLPGPSHSLRSWWEASEETITGDLIFITIPEHRDTTECAQLLSEISRDLHGADRHLHVIAIDRDGNLEMDVWMPRGRKKGFRGQIEWEDLIQKKEEPKRKSRKVVRPETEPEASYPMYRLDIPPFYFPENPHYQRATTKVNSGIVGMGSDQRIFRWQQAGVGARELVPHAPGTQHWVVNEDSEPFLVAGMGAGQPVKLFRIIAGELKEIAMEKSRHAFPREVTISGGALILAYSDFVEAFSIETGTLITNKAIPGLPTRPLLRFDGNEIEVTSLAPSDPYTDLIRHEDHNTDWGPRLNPVAIKYHDGLIIYCDEHAFSFEFDFLRWVNFATNNTAQKAAIEDNFETLEFDAKEGIAFNEKELSKDVVALHDSRGILHLRSTRAKNPVCLSFLLMSGKTAVWDSELGLLSHDQTLLGLNGKPASKVQMRQFQNKFDELFGKVIFK